jgi:hypothetical protein
MQVAVHVGRRERHVEHAAKSVDGSVPRIQRSAVCDEESAIDGGTDRSARLIDRPVEIAATDHEVVAGLGQHAVIGDVEDGGRRIGVAKPAVDDQGARAVDVRLGRAQQIAGIRRLTAGNGRQRSLRGRYASHPVRGGVVIADSAAPINAKGD